MDESHYESKWGPKSGFLHPAAHRGPCAGGTYVSNDHKVRRKDGTVYLKPGAVLPCIYEPVPRRGRRYPYSSIRQQRRAAIQHARMLAKDGMPEADEALFRRAKLRLPGGDRV